jgi:hypothetical protein
VASIAASVVLIVELLLGCHVVARGYVCCKLGCSILIRIADDKSGLILDNLQLLLFVLFFLFGFGLNRIGRISLLNHPVEYVVVFVAHSIKEIFKEFPQISNIWLLIELKLPTMV